MRMLPLFLLLALAPFAVPAAAGSPAIVEASNARFVAPLPASVRELSGLTFVANDPSGTAFLAVGDADGVAVPFSITVSTTTGEILSVASGAATTLTDAAGVPLGDIDLEGVVYDASTNTLLVANESEPGLRRHRASDGLETDVAIPQAGGPSEFDVYATASAGGGFESVALRPDATEVWTITELALPADPSDTLRVQRLDASLDPTGQWAYVLDDATGFDQVNGVADLFVLANGTVLALERAVGVVGINVSSRTRIYAIDTSGATALAGGPIAGTTPVSKTLLYERNVGPVFVLAFNDNYEGMARGPGLNLGDYSLLLVADNQATSSGFTDHVFLALRLTEDVDSVPSISGVGRGFVFVALALIAGGTAAGRTLSRS